MIATDTVAPLPSVVVIGAPVTAASWLRRLLSDRPEVFSPAGESTYFVHNMGAGLGMYRSRFVGWSGEPVRLEFSPAYLLHRSRPSIVAARLHAAIPDLRVIAVVSNPMLRAHQAFLSQQRSGRVPEDVGFDDFISSTHHALDALEIVAAGRYDITLGPYVERFGDRLRIVIEDELVREPLRIWRELIDFVEPGAFDRHPPGALLRFDPDAPPWRTVAPPPDEATSERCRNLLSPGVEGMERLLGESAAKRWFG